MTLDLFAVPFRINVTASFDNILLVTPHSLIKIKEVSFTDGRQQSRGKKAISYRLLITKLVISLNCKIRPLITRFRKEILYMYQS